LARKLYTSLSYSLGVPSGLNQDVTETFSFPKDQAAVVDMEVCHGSLFQKEQAGELEEGVTWQPLALGPPASDPVCELRPLFAGCSRLVLCWAQWGTRAWPFLPSMALPSGCIYVLRKHQCLKLFPCMTLSAVRLCHDFLLLGLSLSFYVHCRSQICATATCPHMAWASQKTSNHPPARSLF
jgi:hypothetical protein